MNKLRLYSFIKCSLVILMLSGKSTLAQTNDSTINKTFDVGFTFSPDYSYRTLKTEENVDWMRDIYDTLEVAKYGYTSGLNLIFRLNENFGISSGISLSNKGERTKNYIVLPLENYTNYYYYLGVPINMHYYFRRKEANTSAKNKATFYLSAGCSFNFYLMTRVKTESVSGEILVKKTQPDLSRLNLSILINAGVDIPLTDRWYFKLEPSYRKSLSAIGDTPIKKYLFSFGANTGLYCRF